MASSLFGLDGKVAVVTGAGRGLGGHMAVTLAEHGADLAICSRTAPELEAVAGKIRAAGGKVLVCPLDVTRTSEIHRMVSRVKEFYGRIDILVNNAGTNIPQNAEDVTESAWDTVMNVNLKAVFFCAQAVGRVMIEQKKGKIINISSQAGAVGLLRRAAYCASKGGVNQITRVLALEWAKHGVNVNAIAPTFVETAMTKSMLEDKEFRSYVFSNILLDRLARPEDISAGLIYLASAASDMVTGHILHIDGGWTAH